MIIQGINVANTTVYDASFNAKGALLYLDAGNIASYSGSGANWYDLSGNGNNFGLSNASYSSSAGGYFNYTGGGLQSATASSSGFNQPYTGKTVIVAANMNASFGTNQYRNLFGCATGTRNFNFYVYSPSAGVYQLHFSTGVGGTVSVNLPITTGQWFVAAATQTLDGTIQYYLNGQPIATSGTNSVTFSQWTTNSGEFVGKADNYWYGFISVVAVYGRALNGDEMQQNFNSLRNRYSI